MASAQIDLYLQGATVSADTGVASTAAVPVVDAGGLYGGALVQAGPGGPMYSVVSVNNARQVTLQNVNGTTLTILVGTRLLVLSSRPIAYPDAFASGSPLGSTLTADSGGQAMGYLPEGSYDYIITDPADPAVVLDSASAATISAATSTMTVNHTVASGQTALLVAIAWQEPTDTDTLDSVTCGSTAMTRLGSTLFVDLYGLLNPPTGSQVITVAWSGSSPKAAVGEAICVSHAKADAVPGLTRASSGSGTTASVTNAGAMPKSLLLAAMGMNIVTGATTETPLSGVTSLWSANAGTALAGDRTQANGASRPSTDDPTTIGWTLGASRAWGILSVEALPVWMSLVTDARCATQIGLLATMYSSLQAAIEAPARAGVGVVYVPAGTYLLDAGLVVSKPNVTLIGEGASTVITPADPVHGPVDLLTITAAEVRLHRLKFDGAAASIDLTSGNSGIVCLGQDATDPQRLVQHCYFENVIVTGNARCGLWLRDTILLTAINCEFVTNKGDGVRIQGGESGGTCASLHFVGCGMSTNGGVGLNIGDSTTDYSGMVSQTFLGCTLQSNAGASIGGAISDIGVSVTAVNAFKLEFLSCYFEMPASGAAQFMKFTTCHNVSVDNCVFFGKVKTPASGPAQAVLFAGCYYPRLSSNVMQGFATAIANFDGNCRSAVEICNRDLDSTTGAPRITVTAPCTLFATSRQSIGLPVYPTDGDRPFALTLPAGSMIFVATPSGTNTHVQVSDGTSTWVQVG